MSGRRSSNCEGSATGIGGRRSGKRQRWKSEIRRRLANQNCDGMLVLRTRNVDVDHLRAGCFQNRPRLLHFYFGGEASVVQVFIQLICLLVLRDGVFQQLFFSVQAACREVIHGKRGVQAQVDYRQIGGARLRLLPIRFHVLANPAPCICLVRQVGRYHVIIKGNPIIDRCRWKIVGIPFSRGRRRYGDGGIVIRTHVPQCSSRLLVVRHRLFQVLVGDVDLLLQGVELRILEYLPPVPAQILVAGLRGLPVSELLVRRRRWNRRCTFIFGPHRTTGNRFARNACPTTSPSPHMTYTS